MSTLDHLFLPGALADALAAGLVRAQTHPTLPLTIYNYTEACVYSDAWNPVTLACRGLIVDAHGHIVSRSLPKFFNHAQPGAPVVELDEKVEVTDKADGSLGIVYPTSEGYAIATRGSFASDQAAHATKVLRTRYPHWTPPPGLTVHVEIVYPGNRIVVDYRGLDDLILLGAVDIATGRSYGPSAVPDWPGPVVETFAYETFGAALAAPPRPGREGLVVHVLATDQRVKLKYEEYLHLHRIVTGLTARWVWEALGGGRTVEEIAAPLPDEFHAWVRSLAARFAAEVEAKKAEIEREFSNVVNGLPEGWSRKDFALAVSRHALRGYLFAHLDGKPQDAALWQDVKPSADETPGGWLAQTGEH